MAPKRVLLLSILLVISILLAGSSKPADQTTPAPNEVDEIIDKYREIIQSEMKKQGIPGFAITLVTAEEILWTEGFGCTAHPCLTQVTSKTPFSIQSMSKSMTAVGILLAVQEGLLDLDEPISTYLPDFRVNSIFDEQPQDTITLRMLLSHTAGFTHEAPIGNNNDPDPGTWAAHIESISDSWLKYPVGQGYSYSNVGIDLAGYILEQVSGKPFAHYLNQELFEPLDMQNSTFDQYEIEKRIDRAIGQSGIYRNIPPISPLLASGGAYVSANDLALYLQFHLNQGRPVLDPQLISEMYHPNFQASQANNYGLGLNITRGRYDAKKVFHNGGGFGYFSQMVWYPDLKVGIAWLSNSQENEHDLINWLSNAILDDLFNTAPEVYAARASSQLNSAPPAPNSPGRLSEREVAELIQNAALEPDQGQQERWKEYVGSYGFKKWGQTIFTFRIHSDKQLMINEYPLIEVEPGLFYALDGEVIDFRGTTPTLGNSKLEKDNGSLVLQTTLLRLCGAGFMLAIFWNGGVLIRGLIHRPKEQGADSTGPNRLDMATQITITLASALFLGTIPILNKFPIFLFSGVPLPRGGLHRDMILGFGMVYTAVALTLLSITGVTLSWRDRLGTRLNRVISTLVTGILVIFSALVLM